MPKPFKLFSTRPLPADAEIVQRDGRPHVRIRDDRGRVALFKLSKDGSKYLKPSKCWYFKYRDAHGTVRRKKGYSDLKATEHLAGEMERKVARVRVGLIDPAEEHARKPLVEHLKDYAAYLTSKGNGDAPVRETRSKITVWTPLGSPMRSKGRTDPSTPTSTVCDTPT